MNAPPLVPPIKCQGIKTKLVASIKSFSRNQFTGRWVEPFCGSCVVALNVQPQKALLCDTNLHILNFYSDLQSGKISPEIVKHFLQSEGKKLSEIGEPYYYEVRDRFNANAAALDFLFLNRSCFNGIVRFNKKGKFNVPYCHKPERFAQSYVTKITNQVRQISKVISGSNWVFKLQDFRETLNGLTENDFVYADPPYAGRHVDYFNSWSEADELALSNALKSLKGKFVLSTWHSNEFRSNRAIDEIWNDPRFFVTTRSHFYHVGSSEDLRHPMIEAFISNFPILLEEAPPKITMPELFESLA